MESALPLLLFLAGLFGFGMLILLCGIQGRELERAEAADSTGLVKERSFFATIGAAFDATPAVDLALVASVESRLRRSTELAARFVDRPSIDTLFETDCVDEVPSGPSLFDRIQSFLDGERLVVSQFVANPTLDRFHDQIYRAVA